MIVMYVRVMYFVFCYIYILLRGYKYRYLMLKIFNENYSIENYFELLLKDIF